MTTSSNITSNGCWFDVGSAETNNTGGPNGAMNAIYYGTDSWFHNVTGPGPWVGSDLENGMYFSNTRANPPTISGEYRTFLSAYVKHNGVTDFPVQYRNRLQLGLNQTSS